MILYLNNLERDEMEKTRKKIEVLKKEIEKKEIELDSFELDEDSESVDYDGWIDEMYEGCELCNKYGASRILKELDPITYRCGLSDYLDGLEKEDFPEYKELQEELEELEDQLQELQEELETLEEESENL